MRKISYVAVSGLLRGLLAVIGGVGLTACTGVAEREDTELVRSAYSVASCATAAANYTRPSGTSNVISPSSYNRCTKSYVVDVPNVEPALHGGVLYAGWMISPNTEAECLDTTGGAIFYKQIGGAWVPINGQNISDGVWQTSGSSGFCHYPRKAFGPLEQGASYRIAATMRRISDGTTQPITFAFVPGRSAELTAGPNHTCARMFNNTRLRCWGSGASAKLGYGNSNDIGDNEVPSAAGDVVVDQEVWQVALGSLHTCKLTADVRCWGAGASGALGYGNTSDVTNPNGAAVVVGASVAQIVAGDNHTCVRTGTDVRCWGAGNFGQLGYGNTNTIGDNETPASAGVVPLGSGIQVLEVVAGANHTCVRTPGSFNNVRCWGLNSHGQLGYGHTNNIGDNETPASAGAVNLGGQATSLAAGGNQTCAVMSTGRVRCWGQNTDGQLGYGHTNNIGDNETPASAFDVAVTTGAYTTTHLAVGARHACVVYGAGSVKCWGAGADGALGYGNTNTIGDNETLAGVGNVNIGPARSIVAGGAHTCAVLLAGQVKCWGATGKHGYPGQPNIGDNEPLTVVGNVNLWGGCADGRAEQQLKGDSMSGCAGIIQYPARNNLCAAGFAPCPAAQWVARRDGSPATHHYWTDDPLRYTFDAAGCFVSTTTGFDCGASTPMRVCLLSPSDPEGNRCEVQSCGFESSTPNEHFGGCLTNTTAGTLCCRP